MNARLPMTGSPTDYAFDADLDQLLAGLHTTPKHISSRYLYDERGSRLFREICQLPEYYPTRTESEILRSSAREIANAIGPEALVVELGSGSADKTRILLDHLDRPAGYVPVDICHEQLASASRLLAADYPQIPVTPVCADFTRRLEMPARLAAPARTPGQTVVFFPGSTIGNFTVGEGRALLLAMRRTAGPGGAMLVGVDLVKPAEVLHAAYNDAAGVTGRFNLNVLRHLNRRFAANFDEQLFTHAAPWQEEEQRIEMQLWCQRDHFVEIGGTAVFFAAGEKLVTEWSHKYTLPAFRSLARSAGWRTDAVWCDPARLFSVHLLRVDSTDSRGRRQSEPGKRGQLELGQA